jgi:hypothetical protein
MVRLSLCFFGVGLPCRGYDRDAVVPASSLVERTEVCVNEIQKILGRVDLRRCRISYSSEVVKRCRDRPRVAEASVGQQYQLIEHVEGSGGGLVDAADYDDLDGVELA